jgi:short-subunit dehydrogenase
MGGQIAFPGMSLYHASKWAVEGFYEALAQELEPFGIRTTLVEPGMARSNFSTSSYRRRAGGASRLRRYARGGVPPR